MPGIAPTSTCDATPPCNGDSGRLALPSPLDFADQHTATVGGAGHDVEFGVVAAPIALCGRPRSELRQRRVGAMHHRHRHAAELLPSVRFEARTVSAPVAEPRVNT